MSPNDISLDLQTLAYHLERFAAAQRDLSTGDDVINSVQGNDGSRYGVTVEKDFHGWLRKSAGTLAATTDKLRADLVANADALREAARLLLERNEISDEEAQRFLAVIDGVAGDGRGPTSRPIPAAGAETSVPATESADEGKATTGGQL